MKTRSPVAAGAGRASSLVDVAVDERLSGPANFCMTVVADRDDGRLLRQQRVAADEPAARDPGTFGFLELSPETTGQITVLVAEELESYEVDIEGYRVLVKGGTAVELQTGP